MKLASMRKFSLSSLAIMNLRQSGFILIEVLIAAFVASLVGAALLASFYQINQSAQRIENIIDVHDKIIIAKYQFDRDFAGVFIPHQPEQKKEEPALPAGAPQQGQGAVQSEKTKSKKPLKKITHIFYGTTKDDQLDTLSFITNNPLQVYWSARAGKATPRVARVVYRLVKTPPRRKDQKEQSYALMRQEGYTLDFDAYKADAESSVRAYEVIDGIKKLTIKYGADIEKKSTDSGKQQSLPAGAAMPSKDTKKPETTYETFKDWDIEDQKKDAKKEGKRPLVPHDMEITMTLWDARKARDITVVLKVTRVTTLQEPSSENAKNNAKDAPAAEKSEAPPQQQPQVPAQQPAQQTAQNSALKKLEQLLAGFKPNIIPGISQQAQNQPPAQQGATT